jgi:acetate CoA/acetoacetate CoA-transferase beta subunit
MDRNHKKSYIAARVAKELQDGDLVNLGIGLPTLIPPYLPKGVNIILQSENGIIGTGVVTEENKDPRYVTDAGGNPAIAGVGGCYIDSNTSFALIRGGHVDVTVLGALEVDEEGSLSNWIIPGKMVPGMRGAMDLVIGAKKVIVAMEHTAKGKHKILKRCRLPYTARNCVDLIITEMGVMEITEQGIVLKEYNPEYTLDEIINATEANLIIDLN